MPTLIPAIAGLALSAAGTAYGIDSSNAAQSKMNQDTSNTVAELQGLQKKATPIYQANLQQATNGKTSDNGIAQALQQYQKAGALPATTAPSAINAPPSQAVDARTSANIQRQTQANAAVAQYPAMTTGWNVGNALTNAQLGNISAVGSSAASTLPAQLSLAQAQGATGQAVGAGIGSLGSLVGTYGASQSANTSNAALLARLNQLAGINSVTSAPSQYPTD